MRLRILFKFTLFLDKEKYLDLYIKTLGLDLHTYINIYIKKKRTIFIYRYTDSVIDNIKETAQRKIFEKQNKNLFENVRKCC